MFFRLLKRKLRDVVINSAAQQNRVDLRGQLRVGPESGAPPNKKISTFKKIKIFCLKKKSAKLK